MEVLSITKKEAMARLRHSLEVKKAAEQRMAEEWAKMGLKGKIVSL